MPRVELIPEGWETSQEKASGDGTPTIDVCHRCAPLFHEGDVVDDAFRALAGDAGLDTTSIPEGVTIGSTEVDHPVYTEDSYECALCNHELGWVDD